MKEQLISFETAKLAKEKGFESSVSNCIYNEEGKLLTPIDQMDFMRDFDSLQDYFKFIADFPNAPTQALLQKWLRETHGLHIDISYLDDVYGYYYKITEIKINTEGEVSKGFTTFEECLEEALIESLKLIP